MDTIEQIKRRIKVIETRGEATYKIPIYKSELKELSQKNIDLIETFGLKNFFIVEDKSDCFAYIGNKCYCLNELYCQKNNKCNFYRNDISINEIEKSITNYNSNS